MSQGPPPKRMKREDDSTDPLNPDESRVVHVRNLAPNTSEADILEALQPYGSISYVTCMNNKRMALVEFDRLEDSKNLVESSRNKGVFIAGSAALFNYSMSKMIQRVGLESEKPSCVLCMTVYNAMQPVNVEVIHTICKTYGEVQRVAILRRHILQALVEFDSVDSAKQAKAALNGADIYTGCNTLKVEFGKPETVKITRSDQDQRDFTLPPDQQAALARNSEPPRRTLMPGADGGYGYGGGYPPPPPPGMMPGGPPGFGGPGMGGYPPPPPPPPYGMPYGPYGMPPMPPMPGGDGCASVVMIYGIDQENWNCDRLFNLLCLYGNVNKIKFMKSKPDTAMIEMGSPEQMNGAISNLHGATCFGSKLALRPSKQQYLNTIREPFDLPGGFASFKDFMASRNQRFSNPEIASRNRICRPSPSLHFYNSPANMNEEKLRALFANAGAPSPVNVVLFQTKSERSSSGIIEFDSVEDATKAIVLANHTPIDSPIGKIPYIFKLAYADGKDQRRGGGSDRFSLGVGGGGAGVERSEPNGAGSYESKYDIDSATDY